MSSPSPNVHRAGRIWSERLLSGAKHGVLLVASAVFMFPFAWMVFGIFKTNNEIWQEPYKLLPGQFDLAAVGEALANTDLGRYIVNSLFVGTVGTVVMLVAAVFFT